MNTVSNEILQARSATALLSIEGCNIYNQKRVRQKPTEDQKLIQMERHYRVHALMKSGTLNKNAPVQEYLGHNSIKDTREEYLRQRKSKVLEAEYQQTMQRLIDSSFKEEK